MLTFNIFKPPPPPGRPLIANISEEVHNRLLLHVYL